MDFGLWNYRMTWVPTRPISLRGGCPDNRDTRENGDTLM
jgi:hypothetical protein